MRDGQALSQAKGPRLLFFGVLGILLAAAAFVMQWKATYAGFAAAPALIGLVMCWHYIAIARVANGSHKIIGKVSEYRLIEMGGKRYLVCAIYKSGSGSAATRLYPAWADSVFVSEKGAAAAGLFSVGKDVM